MDCRIVQTLENGELVCYASNSPEPTEQLKIKKEEPSDVPFSNFPNNFNYPLNPIIPVVFKLTESSPFSPELSVISIKHGPNFHSVSDIDNMSHTPVSLGATNSENIILNRCELTIDTGTVVKEEQFINEEHNEQMEEDKPESNGTMQVDETLKRPRVPNKKYDFFVNKNMNKSPSKKVEQTNSTAVAPIKTCKEKKETISANKNMGSNDNSKFFNQLGLMKTGSKIDSLSVSNGIQVKTEKIESHYTDTESTDYHIKKGLKRKNSAAITKHRSQAEVLKRPKIMSATNSEQSGKSTLGRKEAKIPTIKKKVEERGGRIEKQAPDKMEYTEQITCIAKDPKQMLYPVDIFSTAGNKNAEKRSKSENIKTSSKPQQPTHLAEKHSSTKRYEPINNKSIEKETETAMLGTMAKLKPVLVFKLAKPVNSAKKIQETSVKTPVHNQGSTSSIKEEKIDCSHIETELTTNPKEEEKKKVEEKNLDRFSHPPKNKKEVSVKLEKIDCSHIKTEFAVQPKEGKKKVVEKNLNGIHNTTKKKKEVSIKVEKVDCSHLKTEFAVQPEENKKKKDHGKNLSTTPDSLKKKKESFPKLKIKLSFGGKVGKCMQFETENSSSQTEFPKRIKKPKIMEGFVTSLPKTPRPKTKKLESIQKKGAPKPKTPRTSSCSENLNYSDCFDKPLPPGWSGVVVPRKSGVSIGKYDVYIFSPQGKKLRSRPEISAYLVKENIKGVNVLDFHFTHNPNTIRLKFNQSIETKHNQSIQTKHSQPIKTKPNSKQNSSKATKKKPDFSTQTEEKSYLNIMKLKEKILQGVQKQKSMVLNENQNKLTETLVKPSKPSEKGTSVSSPPLKSIVLKKIGHDKYQFKPVQKHKVASSKKIKTEQKPKQSEHGMKQGYVKKAKDNRKSMQPSIESYKKLLNGRHLSISLVKCDSDLFKFNILPVALKKKDEPSFDSLVPCKASTPVGEPDVPTSSNTQDPILNWIPPKSPYNIIYESLYKKDWQLLIATIIIKYSSASAGTPMVWKFFEQYPTLESINQASEQNLKDFFQMIDQPEKCASQIKSFVIEFEEKAWVAASELKSIGKYGNDAYRIFCTGEWRQVKPLDMDLLTYHGWLTQNAAQLGI
ncbi:hypothetical protein B566_EDAN012925 [Ephemera danica]|nr:hypothetical protein B566_EDAN012925 [Ephemera danica]